MPDRRAVFGRKLAVMVSLLAVATLAACNSEELIEYRGSAFSDASPDSTGHLRLMLVSRTDTGIGGFLNASRPTTFGGSAYAWFEGQELRLLTITEQSDTVLWASSVGGDSIGGKFSVIGGGRKGQGGTWRGTRVRGASLTIATIRAPHRLSISFGSVAATVVYLFLVIGAVLWVRNAPPPQPMTLFSPIGLPIGVGGWLAFFAITQAIGIVVGFSALRFSPNAAWHSTWHLGLIASSFQPLLTFEGLTVRSRTLFAILVLMLVFRKSRYAPRSCFALVVLTALAAAIDHAGASLSRAQLAAALGTDAWGASPEVALATSKNYSAMIAGVVWGLYFAKSLRVRATYGSNALDRAPAPPAGLGTIVS